MEVSQQESDQAEWESGDQSSMQVDAMAIQQLLNSDSMPNGIGIGEIMYVMVGTTTYQITGPQEAGGEVTIAPVTNAEELASIGAVPEEGTTDEGAQGDQQQVDQEMHQETLQQEEEQMADQQQDDVTEQQAAVQQQEEELQQDQGLPQLQQDEATQQQLEQEEASQQQQQLEQEEASQQQQQQLEQEDASQQQQQQDDASQQQLEQDEASQQQQLEQDDASQQQQQLEQDEASQQQQQLEQDEASQQQQQLLQNLTDQQQEQMLQEQQQQLLLQQQQQEILLQQQNQELLEKQQEQQAAEQQQPTDSSFQQLTTTSSEVNKLEGTTISLAGGDFVLQPGQQLPPEIQEMIAKGLPIDMSNFEFVVDDQQQPATTTNQAQDFQYGNNNAENINPNPSEQTEDQPKNGIFVQVVTACPGEFDDGEFPQFPTTTPEQRLHNSDPYIITKSFYMCQYIEYVESGGKMLSSAVKVSQQQHYNPVQQGRSILLNNQMNNRFKRKRMVDDDDDEDFNWKVNDPKRQRMKQQRMNIQPNISKHSSKMMSQQEIMKLHQATTAANHLVFEMPVSFIMQNEPHNYQKGDFVVDKKDAYQLSFAMWRIESSKLLQKFEPFFENAVYLHKSASVYSSWSGDIRTNFRAVVADILSTSSAPIGRKQEIVVRVHNKYVPKPADDKLEQNALMQFFNIYVHVLLNQVFEPAYLTAIRQQNVDYYLEPMTQIDQLIAEAKQGVLLEFSWISLFQVALETWSTYTFVPLKTLSAKQMCQAVDSGSAAVKGVKFYGQNYNNDTLQADQDVNVGSNRAVEFLVGKAAIANLGVYHALHHFKYLLFRRCHDEAVFQVSTQKKSSSDVPDICIQNRIWVQQMFQDLKGLLDRYIIIKTEEENAENNETAQ